VLRISALWNGRRIVRGEQCVPVRTDSPVLGVMDVGDMDYISVTYLQQPLVRLCRALQASRNDSCIFDPFRWFPPYSLAATVMPLVKIGSS
jgi:hypothetical protein